MSNTFLTSLREKRESKTSLIQATLDRAAEEARDLSEVELANVEALNLEIKKLDERIEQMSDIEGFYYGRDVGYKVEQIHAPKEIQEISATKIRSTIDSINSQLGKKPTRKR